MSNQQIYLRKLYNKNYKTGQMGTNVSPTPASMEPTALTELAASTAPVWRRTMGRCVNWGADQRWNLHQQSWQVGKKQNSELQQKCTSTNTWPSHCLVLLVECPIEGPAACHQLCTVSYHTYTCSCMPGFKLQSDERSCLPEGHTFKNCWFFLIHLKIK